MAEISDERITEAVNEAVRIWLDANVESDDEQNDMSLVN
jgi:hypothetical protein